MHRITGYKGLNKVEMCALIVERCRLKAVATSSYPEDNEGNKEGGDNYDEDDDEAAVPALNSDNAAMSEDTLEWDDEAGVGVIAFLPPS